MPSTVPTERSPRPRARGAATLVHLDRPWWWSAVHEHDRTDAPTTSVDRREERVVVHCCRATTAADLESLADRAGRLTRSGVRHAVLELAGLPPDDRAATRAAAHLRVRFLVHGAHVELRDPPPALRDELGEFVPDHYDLVESDRLRPPG
jgi:hypothetical protein